MSPNIKEEWNMTEIPVKEAARLIARRHEKEEYREEGRKEGIEKGIEKGKLAVARSMRSDGLPIETIKKYTGLSENEILQF
jgi:predicted transposase/invertase (TIGR01784 family)